MKIFDLIPIILGLSFIILGFIIWKKQNLRLIHTDSSNLKKEDIKEYTEIIGKVYILIGIATLFQFLSRLTKNDAISFLLLVIWIIVFIWGFVKIYKTERKFKTGIWS